MGRMVDAVRRQERTASPLAPLIAAGPMVLGAIDPGLDRVSLAVFRYTIGPRPTWRHAPFTEKARQFVTVDHVSTSPKLDLGERLELVARGVHAMLRRHEVTHLVIEEPAIAGTYTRHKQGGYGDSENGKFARSLLITHMASGAIIAAARTVLGARVVLVRAQGGKKEHRLETVRMCLVAARVRERVRNQDDLDAIGIGLGADWPT
jgi:hypothetical protein